MPRIRKTTPLKYRCHYLGPEVARQQFDLLGGRNLPKFFIKKQTVSSEGKKMLFWEFTRKLLDGKDIPCIPQEIGDCVSWGARNCVLHLQACEIVKKNEPEKFLFCFAPYFYGTGRVFIGNLREWDDGSTGIWMAKALLKYGVLFYEPNLDVPQYNRQVAKKWGYEGPPKKYVRVGKRHLIKTIARVTSYEQVRDALFNGYPVNVCSNRGFKMNPRIEENKAWGVPYKEWNHSMSFIGIDETHHNERYHGVYIFNSWGPYAHGGTGPDGAPAGGFWVHKEDVDYMVKQGDSYAYSDVVGFKEQGPELEKALFSLI